MPIGKLATPMSVMEWISPEMMEFGTGLLKLKKLVKDPFLLFLSYKIKTSF